MESNPGRLDQALKHIRQIKAGTYPVIMGNSAEGGDYRILERPWQDVPEPSKLAILQDAVNWEGIRTSCNATPPAVCNAAAYAMPSPGWPAWGWKAVFACTRYSNGSSRTNKWPSGQFKPGGGHPALNIGARLLRVLAAGIHARSGRRLSIFGTIQDAAS